MKALLEMLISSGISDFLLNILYIHDKNQLKYMQQQIYLKEKNCNKTLM